MGNFTNAAGIVVIAMTLLSCQPNATSEKPKIESVMEGQARAWNNGDVPGYMKGYWMSDSLLFTGGKYMSRGWEPTLERYLAAYPDQAAMGHLVFDEVETNLTAPSSAFSVGKWTLERDADTLSGRFTLVWKKVHGAWVIVADHSS